jgi:hypothetical protein
MQGRRELISVPRNPCGRFKLGVPALQAKHTQSTPSKHMFQLALASGASVILGGSGPILGAWTRVLSDLQFMRLAVIWGPDAGIHPACQCATRNGVLRTGCGMLCMKNAVNVSCRRLHPTRSLLPLVLPFPLILLRVVARHV